MLKTGSWTLLVVLYTIRSRRMLESIYMNVLDTGTFLTKKINNRKLNLISCHQTHNLKLSHENNDVLPWEFVVILSPCVDTFPGCGTEGSSSQSAISWGEIHSFSIYA